MYIADPLVIQPGLFEVTIATEKFQSFKPLTSHTIPFL
jgi:hypothetical protein